VRAASAAIALGWTLPLGVFAVLRARVVGDDVRGLHQPAAILVALGATAAYIHAQAATSIVLAYAAACAWTDLRARRVYLPVSLAAAALVVAHEAAAGALPSAATGALLLGGFGLALHYGTRGQGFGLGDATNWAIVGAGLGAERGLWAIGAGAALGVVAVVPLIGLGIVSRAYRVPMALCTYAGVLVALCAAWARVPR
jgi:hypothetical protein